MVRLIFRFILSVSLSFVSSTSCRIPTAEAAGGSVRIDLADLDDTRLSELPGITEPEIESLRALAGFGPDDLQSRLSTTDIPLERLRRWAPYLTVSGLRPVVAHRLDVKVEHRATASPRVVSRLEVSLERIDLVLHAKRQLEPPPTRGTGGVTGRLTLTPISQVALRVGAIHGAIPSQNPWDDPVTRSGTGASTPPAFRTRSSASARGWALHAGFFDLAAWRAAGGRDGWLLGCTGRNSSLWLGSREGEGRGIGFLRRESRGTVSVSLHRTESGRSIKLEGRPRSRSTRIGVMWRDDGALRVEAQGEEDLGACRIRGTTALLSRAAGSRSRRRFELLLTSDRTAMTLSGDERKVRLRVGGEVPLGNTVTRVVGRHERPMDRASRSQVEASIGRAIGPARLEASVLLRDEEEFAWPGLGSSLDGASAGRCRWLCRFRTFDLDGELFRTFGSRQCTSRERWAYRIRISKEGEG